MFLQALNKPFGIITACLFVCAATIAHSKEGIQITDLVSFTENEIEVANEEHIDYSWKVDGFDISEAEFSAIQDTQFLLAYADRTQSAGAYLQSTIDEYNRIGRQRSFWIDRLLLVEAQLENFDSFVEQLDLSSNTSADLGVLRDAMDRRRMAFAAVTTRYNESYLALQDVAEYALISQRTLLALLNVHAKAPPGADVFQLGKAIGDQAPDDAQKAFAEINDNAHELVSQLHATVRRLQEESKREARKLKPFRDLQTALQFVNFVLKAYNFLDDVGAFDEVETEPVAAETPAKVAPSVEDIAEAKAPLRQPTAELEKALGPVRPKAPIDELNGIIDELGDFPPDLSKLTAEEQAAYLGKVERASELLRNMEPTYADKFAEQNALTADDIDLIGDDLKSGVFDALVLFITPQTISDGTLSGKNSRILMDQNLRPHVDAYRLWNGQDLFKDMLLMPSILPIEIREGPQIKPID